MSLSRAQRPARGAFLAVTVALAVAVFAGTALAAITWTVPGTGKVGYKYSWDNGDPALASAVNGATTYRDAVYVSDYFKGNYADDAAPYYMGVYFVRTADGGVTWTDKKKLSGGYHADRGAVATSGSMVYATWMSQTKYWVSPGGSTFDPADTRTTYVRINNNYGAASSWGKAIKLPGQTSTSAGDYIYIAASGTNVYITTTDRNTGNVYVWVSIDSGATWTRKTAGTTTFVDNAAGTYVGGFSGLPAIAASGNNVGVAWTADTGGKVVAVTSANNGTTWSSQQVLAASGGADNAGYEQAAGAGTRLAFTWTTAAGAFLKIFDTGSGWQTTRTITAFPDTAPAVGTTYNKGGEGAVVALDGTNTVGIALSECNTVSGITCDPTPNTAKEQLVYRESGDNGATWSTPSVIAAPSNSKTTYQNNYGSLIFVGGDPNVLWNGHNGAYSAYNVQFRIGTGTP